MKQIIQKVCGLREENSITVAEKLGYDQEIKCQTQEFGETLVIENYRKFSVRLYFTEMNMVAYLRKTGKGSQE